MTSAEKARIKVDCIRVAMELAKQNGKKLTTKELVQESNLIIAKVFTYSLY